MRVMDMIIKNNYFSIITRVAISVTAKGNTKLARSLVWETIG